MFERFTERARKVVNSSQEEAQRLGHDYLGTEHLLLGLLREEEGAAVHALNHLGVTLDKAREQVESMVGRGEKGTGGRAAFTPRSKKMLELGLREALRLGHNYIGTEHILLGLVRDPDGVAVRALSRLGTGPDEVQREVIRMIGGGRVPRGREASARSTAGPKDFEFAEPMQVRARVEGLVVHARCGVTDEERATPQPLRVDLDYLYEAGGRDDLSKTVDYGALVEGVAELLEKEEFKLLETWTRMIGEHVLSKFPPVRKVNVSVTKVQVPIERAVSGVSVRAVFYR